MASATTREIRLAARPHGWPTEQNFALTTVELPPLQDQQVLVRNLFMSVDPYMRGRMNEGTSYVAPFEIGKALDGGAIGEVVESRAGTVAPGDLVMSMRGWRESYVADARDVQLLDKTVRPLTAHLSVLGGTGFTAWVGLKLVDAKAGDRVFVSGAAGAVGSIAGQLAKLRGCSVVGSAGSPDKVKVLVDELGFDAAFNYKDGDLATQVAAAAPEGIDVYFDNVGGDQLEAAIGAMRVHGRIAACGAISRYNDETPSPGPRNLFQIVTKRLTIRGFIVSDWLSERPAFIKEVGALVAAGKLRSRETIVEGLERAPQAFIGLMHGANIGKMIVKLA